MRKNYLGKWSKFIRPNIATISFTLLIIVALNIFIGWHVQTERAIYYWDLAGYWTSAIGLSNTFHASIEEGFNLLVRSFGSDYNYLPIAPVAVLMQIFGNSRLVYILSILNLYIVPAILIGSYLIYRYLIPQSKKTTLYVLFVAVMATIPAVMIPVLGNMPDVAGLLVISLIFLTFANTNILTSFTSKSFLIGALICLLIVLRRWYAFWILGSAVALACVVLYILWVTNKRRINKAYLLSLKWPVINASVMLLMFTSILAIFFPFTLQSFMVNYSDVYAAYKSGGHLYHTLETILYFGGITLTLSAVGYSAIFLHKYNSAAQYTASFFGISSVVTFLAFSNTQDFGSHHYYLLLPAIAFGIIIFFYEIVLRLKYKNIGKIIVCLWCILLPMYAFVSHDISNGTNDMKYMFGAHKPPLIQDDISVIEDMAKYLEVKDELVYVVASSKQFNDTQLRNAFLPDRLTDNIITTAHIDRRDGFSNAFFKAEYVVVPSRVQTHTLNGQGQYVVSVLTEKILDGEAKNLKKVKTYKLEKGLEVYIFKKQKDYSPVFISSLKNEFQTIYPNNSLFSNIREDDVAIEIQSMKERE